MLKLLSAKLCLAALITLTAVEAFSQVTLPRTPSPAGAVSQTIGISTVTVNYSRPSVKGREVWGALVPYGYNVQAFGLGNAAPWRAGANENTVIKFSHDATVEGQHIPAGSYGLTFVINKDNSGEVIFSKDYKSWGSFFYDQKNDLFRAKIQIRDAPMTEMLTYDFINLTKTSAELVLNWEKKQFPVKVEFAVDDIVLENLRAELKGQNGFNPFNFSNAANYALANKVDYEEALGWINTALATIKTFPNYATKSGILTALNKTDEANKVMADALQAANEGELNAYGYQLLLGGQQDKAIEIFVLNTKKNPASPNVWDSLGEGYALKGDRKNAIASFKKSLSMNPPAPVKANSEKYMKQLGAM